MTEGNAATLLAELFESWTVPVNVTPERHRSSVLREGEDFYEMHTRALRYVGEIERVIAGLRADGDDVSPWEESFEAWYDAIFAYTTPWKSQAAQARRVIAPAEIRMLRAFAVHMNALDAVPDVSLDQIAQLSEALKDAEELVRNAPRAELDDSGRRYLLALIGEARSCLADLATFGATGLRRVTFELGGAMQAVVGQAATPERKTQWGKAAKSLVTQVVGGTVVLAIEMAGGGGS